MTNCCAVCLHVRWYAAECDRTWSPDVRLAVTAVDGTALCALHMEDWDRITGDKLMTVARRIVGPKDRTRTADG